VTTQRMTTERTVTIITITATGTATGTITPTIRTRRPIG